MKVKNLFNINKEFSNLDIIYGKNYLDNNILNVNIIDTPHKLNYLKQGDFVIITAHILNEKFNLVNLINCIGEKKIACLGIILNNEINNLKQINPLTNSIHFPILKFSSGTTYKKIILALKGTQECNNFLVNQLKNNLIVLKNSNKFSTNNILKILSNYINATIFLLSKDSQIINYIQARNYKTSKHISIDKICTLIKENQFNPISTLEPITYSENKQFYSIYPLETYKKILCYLCIINKITLEKEKNYYLKIINETIPFIIISSLSYHEKELVYHKSKNEFVRELLYALYSNKNTLQKESNYFNVKYDLKRFVWIINIKPLKTSHLNSTILDQIPNAIMNKTLNIAKNQFYNDFCIIDNIGLVFIRKKSDIPNKKLLKLYNNLLKNLEIQMPEYNFSIGISKAYNNLEDLHFAYEDAVFSLKIGTKIFKNIKSIYAYDDLIVYHLLYKYPNNPILQRLYDNGIGKIYKYDEQNNTSLFKTICILIKYNFNYSETANNLFIHRNTLYNRIKRIEEITVLDINNSETRLILQLGLKIHNIYSLNK